MALLEQRHGQLGCPSWMGYEKLVGGGRGHRTEKEGRLEGKREIRAEGMRDQEAAARRAKVAENESIGSSSQEDVGTEVGN